MKNDKINLEFREAHKDVELFRALLASFGFENDTENDFRPLDEDETKLVARLSKRDVPSVPSDKVLEVINESRVKYAHRKNFTLAFLTRERDVFVGVAKRNPADDPEITKRGELIALSRAVKWGVRLSADELSSKEEEERDEEEVIDTDEAKFTGTPEIKTGEVCSNCGEIHDQDPDKAEEFNPRSRIRVLTLSDLKAILHSKADLKRQC